MDNLRITQFRQVCSRQDALIQNPSALDNPAWLRQFKVPNGQSFEITA